VVTNRGSGETDHETVHFPAFVFGVGLLVSAQALAWQEAASEPNTGNSTDVSAVDLVQQALRPKREQSCARDMLLGESLRKDPDCAPARWHSVSYGLKTGGLTLSEAQSKVRCRPVAVGVSAGAGVAGGVTAARTAAGPLVWREELADEARFHWLNVLRIEPLNHEALGALGVQWYNGMLLTRDQVAEQKRKDFKRRTTR